MNVKMSEDAVIFKITEDETKTLLSGVVLKSDVRVGSDYFTIAIDPTMESRTLPELQLILHENSLVLKTTLKTVQALSDLGKISEGISVSMNDMKIVLQIDVRGNRNQKKFE